MRYDLWKAEREGAKVAKNGLKIACGKTVGGRCYLTIWRPKATKPYINYALRTLQDRADYIRKAIKDYDGQVASKNEYKAKQKEAQEKAVKEGNIKVGDLYATSWGYDQTNYDYLAVVGLSKSGKTVKCRMTSYLNMGTNGCCNVQEPIYQPYGKEFTMRVGSGYQGEVSLRGSYPYCGDDSKRLDSFSKVREGEQFNETDSMFGH